MISNKYRGSEMLEIFINIKTEISLGSIAGNSQAIKKRRDENYILLTSFILNQSLIAENYYRNKFFCKFIQDL